MRDGGLHTVSTASRAANTINQISRGMGRRMNLTCSERLCLVHTSYFTVGPHVTVNKLDG